MAKTKIEWCDFSINPVKGLCPVACPYCYARAMYKRFKWDERITYEHSVFMTLPTKPSHIFVGSTVELFGEWVRSEWLSDIMYLCGKYSQHTFIFLTKRPENLIKWSPFPPNCHVGVSVDGTENAPLRRIYNGLDRTKATVKFISFEPLLADTKIDARDLEWVDINWVIIGQQSPVRESTTPKIEWIEEIEAACKKADIPYFEKDNLKSLLNRQLVQELPK